MNKSEMVRSISIGLILQSILMADALQIQAVRSTESIQLDGVPDEKVWQSAPPAPELVQQWPQERGKPSQLSDIRLVFDSQALYVGARFYDSAPDSIVARLGRRDSEMNSDIFIIGLDPYYDKRSGYYFGLSAAGTIYDGIFYNDNWQDDSWDGVWEGVVRRNRDGWSLEMRIPFSQLRFKKSSTYLWGINLTSTRSWRKPLKSVDFTIQVPRQLELTELSLPYTSIDTTAYFLVYHLHFENFYPDKNLIFTWQRRK